MYEICNSIIAIFIGFIILPNVVVELDRLCKRLDEADKIKKRRKKLLTEYNKWYDKAKSCDNFGGAIDKGKAVAMLAVIGHEIEMLGKK